MQEEKKQDRRIVKTKKAIYRAFAQLLLEKDINDITIKRRRGPRRHQQKDFLQLLRRNL